MPTHIAVCDNRHRSEGKGDFVLFSCSLCACAVLIGVMTGMAPAFAIKISLPILLALFVLVASKLPKLKAAPYRHLLSLLTALTAVSILWPAYAIFSFGGLPSIDPKKILLMLLLLVWTFGAAAFPALWGRLARRMRLAGGPLLVLLLFMCWRFFSVATANKAGNAVVQFGWECVSFYLVFFAALSCIDGMGDLRKLVNVILISSALVSLLGMAERVTGHNPIARFIPINPEFAASQLAALDVKLREGAARIQATFEHPMVLAEFMIFVLPLGIFSIIRAARGFHRMLAAGSVALIVVAILYSATRSAIITSSALAFLGMMLLLARGMRGGRMGLKSYFSILGLLIALALAAASLGVAEKLVHGRSADERSSSLERLEQIERGIPKLQQQPLLGVGVGAGNDEIGFQAGLGRVYVDNYYLTLALDSGLPAAILFLLMMGGFAWLGIRLYFIGSGEKALLAGMLGLSLMGVAAVKFVLSIYSNLFFVYLAFAMLIVLKEQIRMQEKGEEKTMDAAHG